MHLDLRALFVSACMLLAGCQTVPYYDTKPQFSALPPPDQGRVLISRFQIPKADLGLFLNALFVPQQRGNHRKTSIYDVTDGVRYIGTMSDEDYSMWFEHDIRAGRRTLMLTRTTFRSFPADGLMDHTDFLELEVKPGAIHHAVISTYGLGREPYFGQVMIEDRHRDACLSFGKMERRQIDDAIEAYMAKSGILPLAGTFKDFCNDLARPYKYVAKPNAAALTEFNKAKRAIEAVRAAKYDNWKREDDKGAAPYDLTRPEPRPEFAHRDGVM